MIYHLAIKFNDRSPWELASTQQQGEFREAIHGPVEKITQIGDDLVAQGIIKRYQLCKMIGQPVPPNTCAQQ